MKNILAFLSVYAVAATLQGGLVAESSDCSSCEKGKTAVGAEAKSECTASKKTLTLKVGGAVCEASCGKLVTALTRLQGVSKAESCTKSQMTKVSYDASKVCETSLRKAVTEAGYTIEGQQVSLPVGDGVRWLFLQGGQGADQPGWGHQRLSLSPEQEGDRDVPSGQNLAGKNHCCDSGHRVQGGCSVRFPGFFHHFFKRLSVDLDRLRRFFDPCPGSE